MKHLLVAVIALLTSTTAFGAKCIRLAKPTVNYDSICVKDVGLSSGRDYMVSFSEFLPKGPYDDYDQYHAKMSYALVEFERTPRDMSFKGFLQHDPFAEINGELSQYAFEVSFDPTNPYLKIGGRSIAISGVYDAPEASMGSAMILRDDRPQTLDEVIEEVLSVNTTTATTRVCSHVFNS